MLVSVIYIKISINNNHINENDEKKQMEKLYDNINELKSVKCHPLTSLV